jgi:hypothetical protein
MLRLSFLCFLFVSPAFAQSAEIISVFLAEPSAILTVGEARRPSLALETMDARMLAAYDAMARDDRNAGLQPAPVITIPSRAARLVPGWMATNRSLAGPTAANALPMMPAMLLGPDCRQIAPLHGRIGAVAEMRRLSAVSTNGTDLRL